MQREDDRIQTHSESELQPQFRASSPRILAKHTPQRDELRGISDRAKAAGPSSPGTEYWLP
jgi:hypothetical protein